MAGSLDINWKEKLFFVESILIPSFDPDNGLGSSIERKTWDNTLSTELIKRYGTVSSLD